jgi:hypothetical protein
MQRNRSMLLALLLIAIGVVLLLRNTDVIPDDVAIWPLIVIGIGVWLLVQRLVPGGGWGHDGYVWPLILIAVGVVFLLRDLDVIDSDVTLWPVILIAIGLGIVLSAVTDRGGSRGGVVTPRSVPLDGASTASVRVKHGAGRLAIRSTPAPESLVDGTFTGNVQLRVDRRGDHADVVVEGRWTGPWDWDRRGFDWAIGLTRAIPVRLTVDAGANQADIDLSDLTIPELVMNTGASDTSIVMPSRGTTDASVRCGAAKVRIRIPAATAARISVRAGLMGVDVDQTRFPKSDVGYRSPGFDTASDRVDLRVEGGAAGLEIR